MDIQNLYLEQLIPSYIDMIALLNRGEIGSGKAKRITLDVAGYLNNFIDYLYDEYPSYVEDQWSVNNPKELRTELEAGNFPAFGHQHSGSVFGIIRDIANTTKHKKIGRPEAHIRSASNISEGVAMIRYKDKAGFYYGWKTVVFFEHQKGGCFPVEIPVSIIVELFTNILIDCGAIPCSPKSLPNPRPFFLSRTESSQIGKVKICTHESWKGKLQLKGFVYEPQTAYQIRKIRKNETFKYQLPTTIEVLKGPFSR